MDNETYFRASDIYSTPATKKRLARRGKLPISRTWFYELLKTQKFPKNDHQIGQTKLWSETAIRAATSIPDDQEAA